MMRANNDARIGPIRVRPLVPDHGSLDRVQRDGGGSPTGAVGSLPPPARMVSADHGPGDVERQVGGVLRFLAGRVRLHRIEAQIPTWAIKSMSPSSSAVTPRLVIAAALDPSAAIVQRQRNVELVERGSAEPHVALDVDWPAPAAAQGLLQVSAQPTSHDP